MKLDIDSLVRKNIQRLKPYSSARDEFQGTASVFLDANENPNPSPYNRYPDPLQKELKSKLSSIKKVTPENIFLGNGSDEPIDLLFRAFCEPGIDNVVIPQPTYGMYSVSANINNIEIKQVSLTPDFDLDVTAIKNCWDNNSKLLFLCSPNNPSGNLLSREKIIELVNSFHGLVIVDEAYIDFTNQPSFSQRLNEFNNLVILQTLSKAWGLAAIRLGMCFANKAIIQVLNKIKSPYNISILTQQIALKELEMEERKEKWVKEILDERENLIQQLKSIKSVITVYTSDANFVLAKMKDAKLMYQKLIEREIVVRDRSSVILCDNCLRITVGTKTENQKLLNSLIAID
ncbi:MAG: histidinol-phosphate transaminase [Chryseotalea sp. WA131a]|jgi:histidinol-phosphate aminotransferase|nr:MAG: histidinol-phosphate transaminase [Chryseotalea sp. WA131a]